MLVSVKLIERQAVFQVGVELQQILKHRVCHFEEADLTSSNAVAVPVKLLAKRSILHQRCTGAFLLIGRQQIQSPSRSLKAKDAELWLFATWARSRPWRLRVRPTWMT